MHSVDRQKHYRNQERRHLSSLCDIIYDVIRWSLSELKRDWL